MPEWNTRFAEEAAGRWENAMAHTENFSAEIHSREAVSRHGEGTADMFDDAMGSDSSRVTDAMKRIRLHGYMESHMTALDIGSGTGIFTIPFAMSYAEVTSLDISCAMQDIIRKKAEAASLSNIRYLSYNWNDVDLKKAGLEQRFDLVLSSLNPRGICGRETLLKMNRASRMGCCLLAFTGGSKNNHSGDLQQLILGRPLTSAGGNDVIMPFDLVYHLGGQPELTYSRICWDRPLRPEAAIDFICDQYWRFTEITPEVRGKVEAYVERELEADGLYHERAMVPVGIMVWDARRVRKAAGQ